MGKKGIEKKTTCMMCILCVTIGNKSTLLNSGLRESFQALDKEENSYLLVATGAQARSVIPTPRTTKSPEEIKLFH